MKVYEEARKGLRHVSQTELSGEINFREVGKRSPLPMLRIHNGKTRAAQKRKQELDPYR